MMMLETVPWPAVLLSVGAALAVLVIYDVAYVWPLCRRYAALADRCRRLESGVAGIAGLASGIADVDRRFAEADNRADERWHQIGERLGHIELATEGRAYEQAIGFAEQGGDSDRLITCFGLTTGEADLVRLLHGGGGSRQKAAGGVRK